MNVFKDCTFDFQGDEHVTQDMLTKQLLELKNELRKEIRLGLHHSNLF